MIVTIDGPAGAGKSSVARQLANVLGFQFLDTGAMYRCVVLAALDAGIDLTDQVAMADIASEMKFSTDGDQISLNGQDVTAAIRTQEVTTSIHYAADNPQIRNILVRLQQDFASDVDVVTEGRDQGTVAFPNAECKIFLTASPVERARRRQEQLRQQGEQVELEVILQSQQTRDEQDEARELGGLHAAVDAVHVVTDGMKQFEVVEHLERLVRIRNGDADG
ncbi:MAG: (d)CMP kinase [Pirellulales bacterium]|nr:(d)CMP kinase [Pirellulales bacterium]